MTATSQTPVVPPRPSRSSAPKIPPRPAKKVAERSVSPNADRFAPSPLNEGILAKSSVANPPILSPGLAPAANDDPIERSTSVPMPSVGEEGMEYGALAESGNEDEKVNETAVADDEDAEADKDDDKTVGEEEQESGRAPSPEQTRTVAQDLKLHAPKPSLPATSAKQRVASVTRTDSERAAAFGIGHATAASSSGAGADSGTDKTRPSTSFSAASDHGQAEDEDGIPAIGQRVPMNPYLGDVQAPSPGPEGSRHHARKHSAHGSALPPGSYGLHGHGVAPQDKLGKAYYEKHPEQLKKEHVPLHDRQNDYAMSSSDLNKLVRDTKSRGAGYGTDPEFRGTPTDEVAFQASEEYHRGQQSGRASKDEGASTPSIVEPGKEPDAIHVDETHHPEYRSYGDEEVADNEGEDEYNAPILAADEVDKDPEAHLRHPAIHTGSERRGSAYDSEDGTSRPASRPASVQINPNPEIRYTPMEEVEEYEPLFTEETKKEQQPTESADENKYHNHFPSKDIWEDAPSSTHHTATVSTPDLPEETRRRSSDQKSEQRPITPAQAFAQHQEELAEMEANRSRDSAAAGAKPTWVGHQTHVKPSKPQRPTTGPRFPSRDVWEDVPESQLHQTIVETPEAEEQKKPFVPSRPAKKPEAEAPSAERPAVPSRPKPKPKPQIPARPASKDAKEKPPIPSRPVGGRIAALQAGFMSDLNKRLQGGPPAMKREDSSSPEKEKDEPAAPVEKKPLSDARKGRARGPQRRAPAPKAAPAAAPAAKTETPAAAAAPTLSLSTPQPFWSIDPEAGTLAVSSVEPPSPVLQICPAKVESAADSPASEEKKTSPPSVAESPLPPAAKEADSPAVAEELSLPEQVESKEKPVEAPVEEEEESKAEPVLETKQQDAEEDSDAAEEVEEKQQEQKEQHSSDSAVESSGNAVEVEVPEATADEKEDVAKP